MRLLYIITLLLTLTTHCLAETKKTSQDDARELFDKAYNQVFGPEGSSFSYAVNIIGLYKTQGNAIYKN